MGNNSLASTCQIPNNAAAPGDIAPSENGILGRVPGVYVAQAVNSLPPPTAIGPGAAAVVVEAGELGLVHFSVERRRAKHGRHSHYFWTAVRAEPFDDPTR
ncbi:hypothetical protein [Cupriavidus sp. D384]|uniref:hypothetical protein n=1 Tax=Cupriavidus sp. D384 TaxID=1538095 RepID=UPI0012E76647|nr:hypothetical protein [Cupriavidus sp. D384]